MSLREFLNRIEHPENPTLRSLLNEARETTRQRLGEWGFNEVAESTVRKLSYTYYHKPEQEDPRYVFLLQDPGGLQERHTEEIHRLDNIDEQSSGEALVDVFRQFPKSWLLRNRNSDFSERFFTTLAEHDLISLPATWREYLRDEKFYEDFYMTDVVKYRVDGFNKTEEDASVNEFLREELREIDPELIFAFGGDAWNVLRTHFHATPVGSVSADTSKITETHGKLFESNRELDSKILPLSHMSGQVWWRFPPDEYIERMEEGLAEWEECTETKV